MSRSSSLLSASTLTICTRPGVRICLCESLRWSLGWSRTINSRQSSVVGPQSSPRPYVARHLLADSGFGLTTEDRRLTTALHQRETLAQIHFPNLGIAGQLLGHARS